MLGGLELEAFVVAADAGDEPGPGGTGFAVFEEKVGAVFVGWFVSFAGPVVVGDDAAEGDIVSVHEVGGEFGRSIEGLGEVIAAVFAHFDANGGFVSGTADVSVVALFAGGGVLDGDVFLDGEVPAEVTDEATAEGAAVEGFGVVPGITGVVLGGVDGDVGGLHRFRATAGVSAFGDEGSFEVDLCVEFFGGDGGIGHGAEVGFPGVGLGGFAFEDAA